MLYGLWLLMKNKAFYDGQLFTAPEAGVSDCLPKPVKGSLLSEQLVLVPACGGEIKSRGLEGRLTLSNDLEARLVLLLVEELLNEGVHGSQISVLCTYFGQKDQVSKLLRSSNVPDKAKVQVQTVDSAQVIRVYI